MHRQIDVQIHTWVIPKIKYQEIILITTIKNKQTKHTLNQNKTSTDIDLKYNEKCISILLLDHKHYPKGFLPFQLCGPLSIHKAPHTT